MHHGAKQRPHARPLQPRELGRRFLLSTEPHENTRQPNPKFRVVWRLAQDIAKHIPGARGQAFLPSQPPSHMEHPGESHLQITITRQ